MDGMDPDIYDETPKPSDRQPKSVDEKDEEQGTDLLSKSSFPGGCKVGDKYTIEITGDHGDQFSVKVMGDEDKEMDHDEIEEMNSKY